MTSSNGAAGGNRTTLTQPSDARSSKSSSQSFIGAEAYPPISTVSLPTRQRQRCTAACTQASSARATSHASQQMLPPHFPVRLMHPAPFASKRMRRIFHIQANVMYRHNQDNLSTLTLLAPSKTQHGASDGRSSSLMITHVSNSFTLSGVKATSPTSCGNSWLTSTKRWDRHPMRLFAESSTITATTLANSSPPSTARC